MSDIVIVGSLNVDLTAAVERLPGPGETVPGVGGTLSAGGKGANQALAAARMGGDVAMVGAVGHDSNADIALHFLRESGVNLDHVVTRGDVTGLAIVAVDGRGENNIIVIPGANAEVDGAVVTAARSQIADASVVVLQGEIPVESIALAARLATGRLLLNLAPVVNVAPEVLLSADPLVVNEYEAALSLELLRNAGTDDEPGEADATASDSDLVRSLLAAGVPSVVMTIGSRGAIIGTGRGIVSVPSPAVEAVDTTGAGDAFVGGLATRLAAGDSLDDAARFAVRVGAAACTRKGAQASYPHSPDELPDAAQ